MCQRSQLPAGSNAAMFDGSNTDRKPWAIHLTGKTEPTTNIHVGSTTSGTYVPDTNCKPTAGPLVTTAAATALLAKLLMKMPT